MKNSLLFIKPALPHAIAILVFIIISTAYFLPQLSGYLLNQSDQSKWLGMSKEILDYKDKYDEGALWTNSMFGGMPA